MVFNVHRFKVAGFPAEFLDARGAITLPTSATLTITYTTTARSAASAVIAMVPAGAAFIGNWDPGASDLGLATLSITAPGQATPATRSLRVLSSHV